jgi:hypothetical protein
MEFPGRIETELTSLADDITNRDELDSRIRKLAADSGLDAEPMLRYAHQHQDIQRMWDAPTEPHARAQARIDADREYWRVAVDNIRRHPLRHFWRRAWRGSFLLWATEIPIRYSDINRLPSSLIRMMWLAQVSLIGVAAWGVVVLIRKNARVEAYVSAALVLYVTAVHAPLYSEARYSLPAKPVVLLLATLGVAGWRGDGAGQRVDGLPPSQSHA